MSSERDEGSRGGTANVNARVQHRRRSGNSGAGKPVVAVARPHHEVTEDHRREAGAFHMTSLDREARAGARRAMIAEAAYFLAEKRRFEPGHEIEDWLTAEAEIARITDAGGVS